MGIESDKLVFDYLSRIGDLAHSTSMTAAERARLVSGLRGEIDRLRAAEGGAESKAAVKKILARLGRPEEVVAARGSATGGSAGGSAGAPGASTRGGGGSEGGGDEGPKVPLGKGRSVPSAPTAFSGASAPHLAGMDELGPEESDPDWWRLDPSPYGDGGGSRTFGEPVPGFVGGIELPELFNPPAGGEEDGVRPGSGLTKAPVPAARKAIDDEAGGAVDAGAGAALAGGRRRLWPGRSRLAAAGPRAGGVVEWVAAALLVAGALIGSLIPLGAGWLAAWWSPRLSRTEAKWAAGGMPGLVAAGTLVWLWGRVDGRWGEPLAEGGEALGRALTDSAPVALRVAAVASALFLVWRARRPRV
ncbi:hypothetical protein [Streptomyces sp. WMMB 322]|uniref:hypothetical protein n=1 Tax=Streptomyces sp. WMMB 322 TaxID=1286821 RepID=UPI0006E1EEC6|nr:hypothetical protein [Streptomyces sp. WMMB 322]SCK07131.1 hypothetical protein H180DRAFT_00246 [Streptomyces sp. WMMB 322]